MPKCRHRIGSVCSAISAILEDGIRSRQTRLMICAVVVHDTWQMGPMLNSS
jgi:hypothetical protein